MEQRVSRSELEDPEAFSEWRRFALQEADRLDPMQSPVESVLSHSQTGSRGTEFSG
jgi:hypothetical protein